MNMLNMTYRTGHNREFILLDAFAYFSEVSTMTIMRIRGTA